MVQLSPKRSPKVEKEKGGKSHWVLDGYSNHDIVLLLF
jgi:hypothetical protein